MNYLNINLGAFGIIATILAIAATVVAFVMIVPERKREKLGRFGKFLACPNFPNCRNTKAIVEKTDVKCPLCGGEIIKRKSKKGKVFYGCEKYPECSFVSWDKPVKEKCPKCGGLMVHKMGHGGGFDACIAEGCGYTTKQNKQDKKGSEE